MEANKINWKFKNVFIPRLEVVNIEYCIKYLGIHVYNVVPIKLSTIDSAGSILKLKNFINWWEGKDI